MRGTSGVRPINLELSTAARFLRNTPTAANSAANTAAAAAAAEERMIG
jgi:hypothetical protein